MCRFGVWPSLLSLPKITYKNEEGWWGVLMCLSRLNPIVKIFMRTWIVFLRVLIVQHILVQISWSKHTSKCACSLYSCVIVPISWLPVLACLGLYIGYQLMEFAPTYRLWWGNHSVDFCAHIMIQAQNLVCMHALFSCAWAYVMLPAYEISSNFKIMIRGSYSLFWCTYHDWTQVKKVSSKWEKASSEIEKASSKWEKASSKWEKASSKSEKVSSKSEKVSSKLEKVKTKW